MENGYYQDKNGTLYKVTDDCILEKSGDVFKTLLYPANFAMYVKMGLLEKKDIVELELEQLTIPLYLNGDCVQDELPLTPEQEFDALLTEAGVLETEMVYLQSDLDARKEMYERILNRVKELEG